MIAYHFTGDTLRDGRPIPAIGEKLVHTGEIIWCKSGLCASPKPHQALQSARGNWLHRVECGQIEREEKDKFVCRERTILQTIDAEQLMRRFAADQALSVAHLWDMPDVVREYLLSLDQAKRDAARDAARAAAWSAARDAARDAAWDAAWDAVRDATRYAVCAAARDAACAAAWDAVWDAAWADFDARVNCAFAEGV